MSDSISRRRLLGTVGAVTTAVAAAGCLSVSVGTMDLVVVNCFEEGRVADVTVTVTIDEDGVSFA